MDIVLVSGLSGAGKSVALGSIGDAGYYCIDNLPTRFIADIVTHLDRQGIEKLAISVDIRSSGLTNLTEQLHRLHQNYASFRVLFLQADSSVLLRRFSETRRKHPLSNAVAADINSDSLPALIEKEREMLLNVGELSFTYRIDTGQLNSNQLRQWVMEWLGTRAPMIVSLQSFSYRGGVPSDSDIVFDMRCLPNPHYEPHLSTQTGKDQAVIDFLDQQPLAQQMCNEIDTFIQNWLPQYLREGRSYLTISIGCTGGQHRSVYMVEQLQKRLLPRLETLSYRGISLIVKHRQLSQPTH
jgi:UPF0042 nucleotide-binding protein